MNRLTMADREKLIELLDWNFGFTSEMPADKLADYLITNGVKIPVLCKDCKYTKRASVIEGYFICGLLKQTVKDNDFCSFGERKNEV